MFTGIVQGTAELVAIEEQPNFRTHVIRMPSPAWGEGLVLGASVSHNGCCLTVTRVEGDLVSFDLMQETLRLTNLGLLQVGDKVNVERAARFGDEIGGHAMSGHIIGMAEVTSVIDTPNNRQVWYRLAPELMKYVLTKGYIGIDGISLTIGEVGVLRPPDPRDAGSHQPRLGARRLADQYRDRSPDPGHRRYRGAGTGGTRGSLKGNGSVSIPS